MCWVLHIVGRDVRRFTNSTYVQLCIPSTCIPFWGDPCLLVTSRFQRLWICNVEFLRPICIPFDLLSHHLGDCIEFRIYLYCVGSHSGILVHVSQESLDAWDLIFDHSNLNHLRARFLAKILLLYHIHFGYTNIYFCDWLIFNTFSCKFLNFTIVILIRYDFALYSIALTTSISARVFQHGSIYFRCIIYIPNQIAHKVLE